MGTFRIEIVSCLLFEMQLNCYSHIFIFSYQLNFYNELTDAVIGIFLNINDRHTHEGVSNLRL